MNLLLHDVQSPVFTVCNIASQLQVHETVVGKTAILGLFVWGIYHFPLTTPFFGSTGQAENMLSILIKIISLS